MPRIEVMGNRADESKGPGYLNQAIVSLDHGIPNLEVVSVGEPESADAVIYCRRDPGTLTEAAEYCARKHKPLVFLSSGIELPKVPWPFPLLVASNTSREVVEWMLKSVEMYQNQYNGWIPKIVEHHQETKKDVSGTAKATLRMMGLDPDNIKIKSVRKFELSQSEFGIPDEEKGGYAAHVITFTNPETGEVSEPLRVAIWGRTEYAKGAIALALAAIERPQDFPNGVHNIFDLVRDGTFAFPPDNSKEETKN